MATSYPEPLLFASSHNIYEADVTTQDREEVKIGFPGNRDDFATYWKLIFHIALIKNVWLMANFTFNFLKPKLVQKVLNC